MHEGTLICGGSSHKQYSSQAFCSHSIYWQGGRLYRESQALPAFSSANSCPPLAGQQGTSLFSGPDSCSRGARTGPGPFQVPPAQWLAQLALTRQGCGWDLRAGLCFKLLHLLLIFFFHILSLTCLFFKGPLCHPCKEQLAAAGTRGKAERENLLFLVVWYLGFCF